MQGVTDAKRAFDPPMRVALRFRTMRDMFSSRAALVAALLGLSLHTGPVRAIAACQSSCTQELAECKRTCAGSGQARRDCRATCAERSTCTAPGAPIRTLAYVVSECHVDPQAFTVSGEQKLVIRRGNCDPVTAPLFPLSMSEACFAASEGVFQRIAVLPDGSGVVFEVTNEFSVQPAIRNLELRDTGMFFVRADGGGLRRLGDASRASVRASLPQGGFVTGLFVIAVSPDGRTLAFSDLGPGPDGRETDQIFTLDIATGGGRKQLTRLQATNSDVPPRLSCLAFLDDRTITFCKRSYTPAIGVFLPTDVFTVPTDGDRAEQPVDVLPVPGGGLVPQFHVTGSRTRAAVTVVSYPATPVDHFRLTGPFIEELFLLSGRNVLQLTNFDRSDTTRAGRGGEVVGRRVFFGASADPFGTNPDQYCQIFSVNTRGTDLRQLTHLRDRVRPSTSGCFSPFPGACSIDRYFVDRRSGAIVFTSNCDPVGENPSGSLQAFGIGPDGSGLRQLTGERGLTTTADGIVWFEPFAYQ